jgi:hypothetical protein
MADLSDDELLAELGVEIEAKTHSSRTPLEERIIAGFEDIVRFFEANGRVPQHGEERDIFERLYAIRLDQIRKLPNARELLGASDAHGLLDATHTDMVSTDSTLDDDALLAELGIESEEENDLTTLRHVKPRAEVRAAETIASRSKCNDFERFKPLFQEVRRDLQTGVRQTRPFELKSEIDPGRFFIVGGQTAYVAEKGEVFSNDQGRRDARLRVIFDNGTESGMLMRSLQRALHNDDAGRRITDPDVGPLFGTQAGEGDTESGTIYVLRSKSDHPVISANRDVIHKIGVTGGKVETRIANAKVDATFLLADVEVIATYELYNINRTKLENLIHRFFAAARVDIQINDRFGNPVRPQEWFLVPLQTIDEAVKAIQDGTLGKLKYDTASARLLEGE